MLPLLIAGIFDQLYIVFNRVVASGISGDISALDYGNRVTTMVSAAFLVTISTVLYPSLVQNSETMDGFVQHFASGINLNLVIGLPATVALVILRVPVTRLVFERGAFVAEYTMITAGTLSCYAIGILGVGLRELCSRGFYALRATRTPMVVGISGVLLNIGLNYVFYAWFGVSGIALSATVSVSLIATVLLGLLRRRVKRIGGRRILLCLLKTGLATGIMAGVLTIAMRVLSMSSLAGVKLGIFLVGVMGVALLLYVVSLWAMKTEELELLLGMVKHR